VNGNGINRWATSLEPVGVEWSRAGGLPKGSGTSETDFMIEPPVGDFKTPSARENSHRATKYQQKQEGASGAQTLRQPERTCPQYFPKEGSNKKIGGTGRISPRNGSRRFAKSSFRESLLVSFVIFLLA
jgi:hypothetical protein